MSKTSSNPPAATATANPESRAAKASRANGKKSKGPITPDGKQKSSRNSLKHGMLAQTIVLDSESYERFDALVEALLLEHSPITESERALVQTMAVARWRQMRTWSVQKTDFDIEISRQDPAPAPVRAALAFRALTDESRSLDVAHRYETAYERQFSRALRDLIILKSSRPRTNNLADLPASFSDATSTWDAEPEVDPEPEPDLDPESDGDQFLDTEAIDGETIDQRIKDPEPEHATENMFLPHEPVPTSEHSKESEPAAQSTPPNNAETSPQLLTYGIPAPCGAEAKDPAELKQKPSAKRKQETLGRDRHPSK